MSWLQRLVERNRTWRRFNCYWPTKTEGGTKVVFAIADVYDAIIIGGMIGNESLKLLTWETSQGKFRRREGERFAFAHVETAAELAAMLDSVGINPAAEFEKSGRIPHCGVGNDFVEESI